MKCPLCHNNGLKVIETYRHKDEGIRRRRKCHQCGFRITTEERPIAWVGWYRTHQTNEGMRGQNQEFASIAELLRVWSELLGDTALPVRDLYGRITACESGAPVYPALTNAALALMGSLPGWGVRELGYKLRKWSGRTIAGRRLSNVGMVWSGVLWRVEPADGLETRNIPICGDCRHG